MFLVGRKVTRDMNTSRLASHGLQQLMTLRDGDTDWDMGAAALGAILPPFQLVIDRVSVAQPAKQVQRHRTWPTIDIHTLTQTV